MKILTVRSETQFIITTRGDRLSIMSEGLIVEAGPDIDFDHISALREIKDQVNRAEDAYGGIVDPELWKRIGV